MRATLPGAHAPGSVAPGEYAVLRPNGKLTRESDCGPPRAGVLLGSLHHERIELIAVKIAEIRGIEPLAARTRGALVLSAQ